jgi:hypothetical protein
MNGREGRGREDKIRDNIGEYQHTAINKTRSISLYSF